MGCINTAQVSANFVYHAPGLDGWELYDQQAGFHPTLEPLLHGVELNWLGADESLSDANDADEQE